ncbi:hypothetical protein H012_gp038 [Acanthamoeba polyphaga moumouvirus]|uniref:Uncharacterized protein n=1 Tax=Acanthamoeba polyphaga moumouvirus TaxID=1269028 RepID=L7RGY4_9VIRU|nr:hypothetical protein H012_gp038 [Acanthamoeba polyphaga moumouvirus]AGC02410.1 hypothetical protein Moumou_00895 [Acanthamoeba polyphaga moumouvirus]AQN68760.1 hypothetical protein [Saudi moumouvirus]
MSKIDISDLDQCEVVRKLWHRQRINSHFPIDYSTRKPYSEPTCEEVFKELTHNNKIDYINGRCIKIDFTNLEEVDTSPYNSKDGCNTGENAFEEVIKSIRYRNLARVIALSYLQTIENN